MPTTDYRNAVNTMTVQRRISQLSTLLFICLASSLFAQQHDEEGKAHGRVFEEFDGKYYPLPGANVYWSGTVTGTTTDAHGHFSLDLHPSKNQLVISFVGMKSDTVKVVDDREKRVVLSPTINLDGVVIEQRIRSTEISYSDPRKTEHIDEAELTKAACCNLSESFETSPSVDVSFTDAVTGTRQIQMLGLAGPYSQLTRENMPGARGIAAIQGLAYTPGPWVKSIQLSKGAGSVLNGFESVTGQINYELRKPSDKEKWFLNAYGNGGGRAEFNVITNQQITDHLSGGTFLHSRYDGVEFDRNDDGFMDKPVGNNLIGLQRLTYSNNGWHIEGAIKGVLMDRISGQLGFDPAYERNSEGLWGARQSTKRAESWLKVGKVDKDQPYKSVGFQLAGVLHDQKGFFGLRDYDANHKSLYSNLIYQSIIGSTIHTYKTGLSLLHDNVNELFDTTNYWREEWVPGAFLEYTYTPGKKFNAVVGGRLDWHNQFGWFTTPRIHLRYAATDEIVIRGSSGRGQRTASVLSENMGYMASNRSFKIGDGTAAYYGLEREDAWNYGLNATYEFELDFRPGRLSADLYRSHFTNQVVVDIYSKANEVSFYNLDGQSFANSFQLQLDYEVIRRLDVRLAYRIFDVKSTYDIAELQPKPLLAKHRGFLNLGYKTKKSWKMDYTLQLNGHKSYPDVEVTKVSDLILGGVAVSQSPIFTTSNVQISKEWKEVFEMYLGAENLFNYRQDNPIISAEQPFDPSFNASLVWGPVFGRTVYFGLRYKILK